tara:strand:+ start:194 stop:460 length:267 start_codon:yes stop_codon:yes gene_type:complete
MDEISTVVQTDQIVATISKLNDYRDSHPNLYRMWDKYIMLENTHYQNIIDKCNQAMQTMDHEPDINVEQLLQLMLANRVSQSFIGTMT